jgi:predicted amidohydrolase
VLEIFSAGEEKQQGYIMKAIQTPVALEYEIVPVPETTEDSVTVACVNFETEWGNKQANLKKIKEHIGEAVGAGANIIVIPELALSGYDVDEEAQMHHEQAETVPGPVTIEIAELTTQHNIYVILGLPERDDEAPSVCYNSAAVMGPQGIIGTYRKIQPWNPEMKWCSKGTEPFLFESPWGSVAIGICLDTYNFPELLRYYSARGALLYINPTAIQTFSGWRDYYLERQKARVREDMFFVASANLVGQELKSIWAGSSIILGPSEGETPEIYAGPASEEKEEIIMATLVLTLARKKREKSNLFKPNPLSGEPDWRPELYSEWYRRLRFPE